MPKPKEGTVTFSLRIPHSLRDRLAEAAASDQRSITQFIRIALERELARQCRHDPKAVARGLEELDSPDVRFSPLSIITVKP